MDYSFHYSILIIRARNRTLTEYSESHHIIPRCMGGTDDLDNLVELTPEEHFVAHQLLIKMYPTVDKLVFAAKMMTIGSSNHHRGNKLYGWLRRRFIESISKPCSEETKAKISIANKGGTGRTYTEEHKAAVSAQWSGYKRSEENKRKISEARKGIVFTDEHKTKLSLAAKTRTYKRMTCIFCNKECTMHNIVKYHNDNCKLKNLSSKH